MTRRSDELSVEERVVVFFDICSSSSVLEDVLATDGETWRPLRVSFPSGIASHGREQISYFGPDGLLRRHEYRVDVLGGAPGLNYAHEFRDVDGVLVAMKRRVYAFDTDKRKIPDPLLVAIDIHDIAFS